MVTLFVLEKAVETRSVSNSEAEDRTATLYFCGNWNDPLK